jgi:serine/threonine protein phosphatase PrpC
MDTSIRFENRFLLAQSIGHREQQQDAGICLCSANYLTALLVVSDGVGGHIGGDLAAHTVTRVAEEIWELAGGRFADPPASLRQICLQAHDEINELAGNARLAPRTTVVAVYVGPDAVVWLHSGDSRLYHFRGPNLLHRTEDHSVLQLMIKGGLVAADDARGHPEQNSLLQALGGREFHEPTVGSADWTPEDGLVLCTDGFWQQTSVADMNHLLATLAPEAPAALKKAIQRAVRRNGPASDNTTALIALPEQELPKTGFRLRGR